MKFFEEELLEPIARTFRFRKGLSHIPKNKKLIIADLGCGPKIRFYHYAKMAGIKIKKYIGIDPLIDEKIAKRYEGDGVVKLMKSSLKENVPLKEKSVDIITGFAFIEHVDNPKEIIYSSVHALKKGGRLIFTTPTPLAKSILEFLSYKLEVISPREIKEHKNYFDKNALKNLTPKDRSSIKTTHRYFEAGLNNLLVVTKVS